MHTIAAFNYKHASDYMSIVESLHVSPIDARISVISHDKIEKTPCSYQQLKMRCPVLKEGCRLPRQPLGEHISPFQFYAAENASVDDRLGHANECFNWSPLRAN
jgi:hypothetical protein